MVNIVWKRLTTGDVTRTEQEGDEYLSSILTSKNWIIEGVHHKWVYPCFQIADLILFLVTNLSTRRFRIIKRFLKQKIGIERANYKPTLKILKDLYNYNTMFEYHSKPEIIDILSPYKNKLTILKSNTVITDLYK
ncbi:DNA topology modulation protein FlaR [Cytobacillus firmus]|uniref:DNA topology modulation protein FlaR n=1 Tax=Cytobacillus firmus TaxID=1399 RepID=UPI0032086643